ncbi:12626_t:CDS:2 [Acaulospora morrowiae]|uniref:12626_t:CDS:1 n=1 Tax=Acaulospora morrowiae TaxID=94023 RepID=A0A9N8V6W1_9GLOM|nr:12626_t:CDS:2 [Acaulospora morrowiae]
MRRNESKIYSDKLFNAAANNSLLTEILSAYKKIIFEPVGKAVMPYFGSDTHKSSGNNTIVLLVFSVVASSFLLNHILDFALLMSEIFVGVCLVYFILNSFTPLCEIIITYFNTSFGRTRNHLPTSDKSDTNREITRNEEMMKLVAYHCGEQDQLHENFFVEKQRERMTSSMPKLKNSSCRSNLKEVAIRFFGGFLAVAFLLKNITHILLFSFNIFVGTCLIHIILCSFTPFHEIVAIHFTKPNQVVRDATSTNPVPFHKNDCEKHTSKRDDQHQLEKNTSFTNTLVDLCTTQASFVNLSISNHQDTEKPEVSGGSRDQGAKIDKTLIMEGAQDQEHKDQSIEPKIDELPISLKVNKNIEQIETRDDGTSVSHSGDTIKLKEIPEDNLQAVTAPLLDAEDEKIPKVSFMPTVEINEIFEAASPEVSWPEKVSETIVTREVEINDDVQVLKSTELMTNPEWIQGISEWKVREVEKSDDATIFVNLDSDRFSESESASISTLEDHNETVKSCKPVYEPFTEVHVAPPSELFLHDVIVQLDQEIRMIAEHEKKAKSLIEEKEMKEERDQEYKLTKRIQETLMNQIHILNYQKLQYEIQERENALSPKNTIISVPAFTLESADSRNFAVYIIMVQQKTEDGRLKSGWVLSRRYNEFFSLYQHLKKMQLCEFNFPKKTLFADLNNDLLEFRREKFNELLQVLISNPKVCNDIEFQKFLYK